MEGSSGRAEHPAMVTSVKAKAQDSPLTGLASSSVNKSHQGCKTYAPVTEREPYRTAGHSGPLNLMIAAAATVVVS
ncbi:MAG: hypothetical protein JWN34_200 [Bryobacterales bacterium]|nr:hypothetical protein [Bryobacterales bacterium]